MGCVKSSVQSGYVRDEYFARQYLCTSFIFINVRKGMKYICITHQGFLRECFLNILNMNLCPEAFGRLGEADCSRTGNIFAFILAILIPM